MKITVQNMIQIKELQSLKLLTNQSGLNNVVSKIGILDYEFTRQGHTFCANDHWRPGEFVLTTFSYARESPSLMLKAVQRLQRAGTSGLAIKNVFQLKISDELIRFANQNHYPIFLFTDENLFFEDVIIQVHHLVCSFDNLNEAERQITKFLETDYSSQDMVEAVHKLVPLLPSKYRIANIQPLHDEAHSSFRFQYHTLQGAEGMIFPYQGGYFYISNQEKPSHDFSGSLAGRFSLRPESYRLGISNEMLFPSQLKQGLFQSLHAIVYGKITKQDICYYHELGAYQILIPYAKRKAYEDFFNGIIPVILDYDLVNGSSLLDTAMDFEACHGNIKEMAQHANIHENTIRYRLKKLADLFDANINDTEFISQLVLAVKLYRIQDVL